MDQLPDLYPIVIPSIQQRPFDCFGEGLRYRGPQAHRYARESLLNIKELLMAEKELDADERGSSIFWYAQLRLYGVECRPAKADVLHKIFREAIQNGLRSPPRRLLQLEAELNQRFLVENAQERDRQYEALDSAGEKILFYPKRYFREYFADPRQSLFAIQRQLPDEAQDAAEGLRLHFICAKIRGRFWTVVGRDAERARGHLRAIDERDESAQRVDKRRRVVYEKQQPEFRALDEEQQQQQQQQRKEAAHETVPVHELNLAADTSSESFRRMDVAQMDRIWRTLDEDRKLELYPTRFLSEQFLSEGRGGFVQAFKETEGKKRRKDIRAAAELLGLRTAAASVAVGDAREEWTVVGRDQGAVEERRLEIEGVGYETLEEAEQFERFPKRFLAEKLLSGDGEGEDRVMMLDIRPSLPPLPPLAARMEEAVLEHARNGNEKVVALRAPPEQLPGAAKALGLLMAADVGALRWIVVGRDGPFVRERMERIEAELEKPERQRAGEQVRAMHEELEAAAAGDAAADVPFDDVKGEWSIECEGVQWTGAADKPFDDEDDDIYERAEAWGENANAEGFEEALKKMSIFFRAIPPPVPTQDDPTSTPPASIRENGEKVNEPGVSPSSGESPSLRLCANFFVGLFGGLLRSGPGPLPQSLCCPSPEIPFEFKGWDEAAGDPFDETQLPREGSLTFQSRTLFKGVLKSMYGVMHLVGRKIGHIPNVECYDWDDLRPHD